MRTTKVIAAVFAATIAVGVTACGGDDGRSGADAQNQEQPAQEEDTAAQDAETGAKPAEELKADVEVVECQSGDSIGVSATLEVTNSLDEPAEYLGTIVFRDAEGTQLTEGVFNTGTLQPGEKSTEDVPGANVYEVVQGATCEVAEVAVDEPV